MSRIGKEPVVIPEKVEVKINGNHITVKGPLGSLERTINEEIILELKDKNIIIKRKDDSIRSKSMHGLSRTLVNNMVTGVSKGYTKILDIVGVGYKAETKGKQLILKLGYSHPIKYDIPEGITIKTPKPVIIEINGIDKELVGQVAATIRMFRPPEPYKGKGIKYRDEYIIRKEGKRGI